MLIKGLKGLANAVPVMLEEIEDDANWEFDALLLEDEYTASDIEDELQQFIQLVNLLNTFLEAQP